MGPDAREGQALLNRPMYLQQLCQQFLPVVTDLHAILVGGGQVADLGMGRAGRRSRSPSDTRRSKCTASTSTRHR